MTVKAANLPLTCAIDRMLHGAGVVVVPDLLVNAGGVTVSGFEWTQNSARDQWTREQTIERIEAKLDQAWQDMRQKAGGNRGQFRDAAYNLGVQRICEAIHLRKLKEHRFGATEPETLH